MRLCLQSTREAKLSRVARPLPVAPLQRSPLRRRGCEAFGLASLILLQEKPLPRPPVPLPWSLA